jgi:hypothetical protein
VNILLANKNGLVVVTDSRLSDGRHPLKKEAQKLFQIDDRTVCTIASWYSNSGPLIDPDRTGKPSSPAMLAVPGIIQSAVYSMESRHLSIEKKMSFLEHSFEFAILFVANINRAAGIRVPPVESDWTSEITLAGFDDNGVLKILQTDLVPEFRGGEISGYTHLSKPTISTLVQRKMSLSEEVDSNSR